MIRTAVAVREVVGMATTIRWTFGGSDEDREYALTALRDAWNWLYRDARLSGIPQAITIVEDGQRAASALTTESSESAVLASVDRYLQVYTTAQNDAALRDYLHATPPVETIPLVETGATLPRESPTLAAWEAIEAEADRVLPATDELRRAIHLWSQDWREKGASRIAPRAAVTERHGELIPFARARLGAASNRARAAHPPPAQPAPGTARPPQRGGAGGAIAKAIGLYFLVKALRGR